MEENIKQLKEQAIAFGKQNFGTEGWSEELIYLLLINLCTLLHF